MTPLPRCVIVDTDAAVFCYTTYSHSRDEHGKYFLHIVQCISLMITLNFLFKMIYTPGVLLTDKYSVSFIITAEKITGGNEYTIILGISLIATTRHGVYYNNEFIEAGPNRSVIT